MSKDVAVNMAETSYKRGCALLVEGGVPLRDLAATPVVGIGCTAAVVSSSPRRGLHACHVVARMQVSNNPTCIIF